MFLNSWITHYLFSFPTMWWMTSTASHVCQRKTHLHSPCHTVKPAAIWNKHSIFLLSHSISFSGPHSGWESISLFYCQLLVVHDYRVLYSCVQSIYHLLLLPLSLGLFLFLWPLTCQRKLTIYGCIKTLRHRYLHNLGHLVKAGLCSGCHYFQYNASTRRLLREINPTLTVCFPKTARQQHSHKELLVSFIPKALFTRPRKMKKTVVVMVTETTLPQITIKR